MIFWAIFVFALGIVGLIHEYYLTSLQMPIFSEMISVCLMLVSLGMLYTHLRAKKRNKK